jgi:isopenicillin N synthase-like dioxygenase
MSVSSFIHYPVAPAQLNKSGEAIRNPPHSDLGTLTLLFQHDVGGLQIADMSSTTETSSTAVSKDARFLDVQPSSEMVLVNVGYLLMRWTNGRWKNTVHRVSEPPSVDGTKGPESRSLPERYSIAFFSFPNAETAITPLSTCCNAEMPKKWGPLNAGKYLLKKRGELYAKDSNPT